MLKIVEININLLKEVIEAHVKGIEEQLEGISEPKINKFEAIKELGVLSSIVINLHVKVEEQELKDKVWELKHEADTLIERLFTS